MDVNMIGEVAEQVGSAINKLANIASSWLGTGAAELERISPWLPEFLSRLPEVCLLCLAIVVLLLCRRVRRDRAAIRGLAGELQTYRRITADSHRLQLTMEERLAGLRNDIADLAGRQRSMEARVGKPDSKLAVAMARAGTRPQQMVECGLSHAEVHLLRALNAGVSAQAEPASVAGA